jgi:hypothetical protein
VKLEVVEIKGVVAACIIKDDGNPRQEPRKQNCLSCKSVFRLDMECAITSFWFVFSLL